jgi:OOP family OmpA-OmpF porin
MRQESESALNEIALALERHTSWKLRIESYTDNIGDERFNLELSKRRAEAVIRELIAHHHTGGSRLTASGFGSSNSKEPGDTLEGRARNRRVELVLQ